MSISRPSLNYQIVPDTPVPDVLARRTLIIGQKLPAGSVPALTLFQDVQNNSQENALFGAGSQVAAMVKAFKALNQISPVDVICLDDDGGATAASAQVSYTGIASSAGTIEISVGSERNNRYVVSTDTGGTEADIALALANLINADPTAPVTASPAAGVITLDAKNAGEVGNGLSVKSIVNVTGTDVVITPFAGGATNPVLTSIASLLGNIRYTSIVAPYEYGTTFLEDILEPRFNSENIVLDGIGLQATHDTFANLSNAATGINSQSNVIIGYPVKAASPLDTKQDWNGSAILEFDYVIASYYAALRELRLFDGANISSIVSAGTGALDKIGGPAIASLPYFNTPFSLLPLVPADSEFTDTEINALRDANISVIGNNRNRTSIIMSDAVTTYVSDSAGNPDDTFKFLNAVDTSSIVREVFFNRSKAKYAQTRLTSLVVSGYSNATVESIKAFFVGVYQDLSGAGFNLVQGSPDAINYFKDNLNVTITNFAEGTVTVTMKLPINSQLRAIDSTLSINLSLIS